MAELQWVVEVRCVNAVLAEIKVGERGQHAIVVIPDRRFDPSEFGKLIEGLEAANSIAEDHRRSRREAEGERVLSPAVRAPEGLQEIDRRDDLYTIQILKTGELVSVNVHDSFFTPSELRRFIGELRAVRDRVRYLRQESEPRPT